MLVVFTSKTKNSYREIGLGQVIQPRKLTKPTSPLSENAAHLERGLSFLMTTDAGLCGRQGKACRSEV